MFGWNIGFMEFGLIALVLLLLFGAKRIPTLIGSLGEGIRQFKHQMRGDVPRVGRGQAPDTTRLEDRTHR